MLNSVEKIFGWSYKLFKKWEFGDTAAAYMSLLINITLLCLCAYIIYVIFRFVLITILAIVAKKTKTKFDDLLISNKTAKYIAHLIPLLFVYKSVPIIMKHFIYWETIFGKAVGIYIVLLSLWITRSVFNAIRDYLKQIPKYNDKPIDSYIQVVMIVLWIIGLTIIVLMLFNTSFKTLFTTIGAISAIIILIFRDTILGFVASVQVSINDMVRIGDWITMDKFDVDGDVIEISLSTVKVRNFDHTTTTIPTYSLISDSFKNWRGMLSSDGRRIKRHILIKPSSIRFLSASELENMKKIQLITDYISRKQADNEKYNQNNQIDRSININGKTMTNFGLYRKYVTRYLKNNPSLNKNMPLLCRQLQPIKEGIPFEIYTFTNDKKFENYEYIISDIFDHIVAAMVYFDLEMAQ
jgi:miniconductance mechanosensitive channel